jgi:rSAM/selenodomain-associated transferase 1
MVIYAKAPRSGRVKTRLSPAFHPDEAAKIYELSLRIAVEQVESLDGVVHEIWISEAEDRNPLARIFPKRAFRVQVGEDLGERLCHTFETLFSEGGHAALIMGSDAPTLPRQYLQKGIELLGSHDCVLGPTQDGGYYAMGLRRLDPQIFEGVGWSRENVLSETIVNLKRMGWSYELLPEWYDIDRPEDLTLAWQDLQAISRRTPDQERFLQMLSSFIPL